MTETEIVEEAQQTVVTCLQDYYKLKVDLKEVKAARKEHATKALESDDYIQKRSAVKEMQKDMKETKEEVEEELKKDERYGELRKLELEANEKAAHARLALVLELKKLPPEPTQLSFEFEGEKHKADIEDEKVLYIDGKLDKL